MQTIKLLIVEDNAVMQRALKELVAAHFPEVEIIGKTGFVETAIKIIETDKPDIVILDIHLLDGTAFDILKQVDPSQFKVIFISAYHEYMLESLHFSSVDFIFKPFDIGEVVLAIDKAIREVSRDIYSAPTLEILNSLVTNITSDEDNKQLVLIGHDQMKSVWVRDIMWGEAKHRTSEFHFTTGESFISTSILRHYESFLSIKGFFRCHSHYLVNTIHIDYVDPLQQYILLKSGEKLPFESTKYDSLMVQINSNVTVR